MRSTIPRIPHLPGSNAAPDDLVLDAEEAKPFFTRPAVIVEKLDGISLTVRRSALGGVGAGLRDLWRDALGGRVQRAADLWMQLDGRRLLPLVRGGSQLYGEWLWHRLVIPYDRLPGPVLWYALRDPKGRLVPRRRVMALLREAGLPASDPVYYGVIGRRSLSSFCRRSRWARARGEGLVVEIVVDGEVRWAKWVRRSYDQPTPASVSGAHNGVVEPRETTRP
jgi:hypothetical protein